MNTPLKIPVVEPDKPRALEIIDALTAAGIAYGVVLGVTAASAASAAMGGFLTERGTCDALMLATGQSADAGKRPDWITSLRPGMRVAVYMGVASADEIAQNLIDAALAQHIGIDIVSNAKRSNQVIVQCTATTLVETIQTNAIENPEIFFLAWPQSVAVGQVDIECQLEHAVR